MFYCMRALTQAPRKIVNTPERAVIAEGSWPPPPIWPDMARYCAWKHLWLTFNKSTQTFRVSLFVYMFMYNAFKPGKVLSHACYLAFIKRNHNPNNFNKNMSAPAWSMEKGHRQSRHHQLLLRQANQQPMPQDLCTVRRDEIELKLLTDSLLYCWDQNLHSKMFNTY